MKLFLNSNKEARNYIERLYKIGSNNFFESTINYNIQRTSSVPIGTLSLVGDVEDAFQEKEANIIADFLVVLWEHIFKDFSKSIGILIEFTQMSSDSYMVVADFDKEGKISKVFISISTRSPLISDILQNIAHEFLHVEQYLSNALKKDGDYLIYLGKKYPYTHLLQEWETFDMQHEKDVYSEEESLVDLYREDFSDYIFEKREFKESLLKDILDFNIVGEVIF